METKRRSCVSFLSATRPRSFARVSIASRSTQPDENATAKKKKNHLPVSHARPPPRRSQKRGRPEKSLPPTRRSQMQRAECEATHGESKGRDANSECGESPLARFDYTFPASHCSARALRQRAHGHRASFWHLFSPPLCPRFLCEQHAP